MDAGKKKKRQCSTNSKKLEEMEKQKQEKIQLRMERERKLKEARDLKAKQKENEKLEREKKKIELKEKRLKELEEKQLKKQEEKLRLKQEKKEKVEQKRLQKTTVKPKQKRSKKVSEESKKKSGRVVKNTRVVNVSDIALNLKSLTEEAIRTSILSKIKTFPNISQPIVDYLSTPTENAESFLFKMWKILLIFFEDDSKPNVINSNCFLLRKWHELLDIINKNVYAICGIVVTNKLCISNDSIQDLTSVIFKVLKVNQAILYERENLTVETVSQVESWLHLFIKVTNALSKAIYEHFTNKILGAKNQPKTVITNDPQSRPSTNPFLDTRLVSLAGGVMGKIAKLHKKKENSKFPKQKHQAWAFSVINAAIRMKPHEQDKLPPGLRRRNKGNLYFLNKNFEYFLKSFEEIASSVITEENYKAQGKEFAKLGKPNFLDNQILKNQLVTIINDQLGPNTSVKRKDQEEYATIFLRKMTNARFGDFIRLHCENDKGGLLLRDTLKSFPSKKKKGKETKPNSSKRNKNTIKISEELPSNCEDIFNEFDDFDSDFQSELENFLEQYDTTNIPNIESTPKSKSKYDTTTVPNMDSTPKSKSKARRRILINSRRDIPIGISRLD